MTKFTISILASLTLSLAACGKVVPLEAGDGGANTDSGTGDGGSSADADVKAACDSPIAFDDLPACLVEAQCQQFTRCTSLFLDLEECKANISSLGGDFDVQLVRFANAIDAGKAEYDPVAAATCLESLSGAACSQNGDQTACDLVFHGNTPPDGACLEEFECGALGSNCNNQNCDGTAQCCAGSCQPPVDVGQLCNSDPCKPGDHCVRSTSGGQNNFVCQSGNNGSPCEQSFECDDQLFCEPSLGSCVPTRPSGANCASQDECSGDDDCVVGTCQSIDTAGDACNGFCLGSLSCQNGTCVALPGQGENCTAFGQCNSVTLDCFGTTTVSMCVPKQGLGDNCDPRECAPGLVCEAELPSPPANAKCIMPLPTGSACDRDRHCASNECDFGATNAGVCVAPVDCYSELSF